MLPQAQAETLLKADNKTGYFGVHLAHPGKPKPYQAQVSRGGNLVSLGTFAAAEEAALCVARSPEGQEAAKRAAAPPAPPLTSEEVRQQAQAERLTPLKADNTAGYFDVHHKHGRPKPYQAQVRRGGMVATRCIWAALPLPRRRRCAWRGRRRDRRRRSGQRRRLHRR